MEGWQGLRIKRAQEQGLTVTHVDCTEDSFMFNVQGVSSDYVIEIYEDVDFWPPRCDCEDNIWRPDIRCKHILLCLALMGVEERDLEDCNWVPQQEELYAILANAPDCVGCTLSKNHGTKKPTAHK